jgi:hypothetical protein
LTNAVCKEGRRQSLKCTPYWRSHSRRLLGLCKDSIVLD